MQRCSYPPLGWPEPAVFRFDPSGQVRWLNPAAQALLQQQAELFTLRHGRLQVSGLPAARQSAASGAAVAAALPRAGRLPLTLQMAPMADGQRVIAVQDPEQLQPDLAWLRELFRLTPSEARVTAALALGHSTEVIALRLQVQVNTVQAHLKSALSKTGLSRQTQLVSLVLRSAAMWPRLA